MDLEDAQKVDRATWKRYLFYVDLAVIATFAVALILLVRHAFLAGQAFHADDDPRHNRIMWLVAGDTAFLVGSLAWIFYRFFRNQYTVLTRRF